METSYLLDKSAQNRKAARLLLHREKLYASSVHCGYYSCIQKVLHVLQVYFTEEFDDMVKNAKDPEGDKRSGKGDFHGGYIKLISWAIMDHLKQNKDGRKIRDKLIELKKFRIKSDYYDVEINEYLATKADAHVEEVHKIILKHISL